MWRSEPTQKSDGEEVASREISGTGVKGLGCTTEQPHDLVPVGKSVAFGVGDTLNRD